jgi:hypothetical protein
MKPGGGGRGITSQLLPQADGRWPMSFIIQAQTSTNPAKINFGLGIFDLLYKSNQSPLNLDFPNSLTRCSQIKNTYYFKINQPIS